MKGIGILLVTLALAHAAGVPHRGVLHAGSQAAPVRQVVANPGEDVLSKLVPTDQVLELVSIQPDATWSGPPPGMSLTAFLARNSPVACIVKVKSVRGQLRETRDWVDSVISAEVLESFRDDTTRAARGLVTFMAPSGEINVAGQVVRATRSHQRLRFEPGRSYLIFATLTDGRLWVDYNSSLLVDGNQLEPMTKRVGFERYVPSSAFVARQEIGKAIHAIPK